MLFSSSTRYIQIEMFQVNINISNGLSHTINPIRNLEEFIILIFDYEKSVFRGGSRIFWVGGLNTGEFIMRVTKCWEGVVKGGRSPPYSLEKKRGNQVIPRCLLKYYKSKIYIPVKKDPRYETWLLVQCTKK